MVKSERKKERKNPATPLTRKTSHPPTDDGFDCGDFDTLTLTGSEMTRS